MLVSAPKLSRPAYQGRLFETPIGNHGHCRTIIGALCEELTELFFDGRRHVCGGAAGAYCPDISLADGRYIECKGAGRRRSTFIYAGRLEKDREFAVSHELIYVVWSHSAITKNAETVEGLRRLVLASLRWCAAIPFAEIDAICRQIPVTRLNSKYGKRHYGRSSTTAENNRVYGSGYRIPVKLLEPWIAMEFNYA